jgi:hypothetical protein
MRFFIDFPLEQWVYIKKEKFSKYPWAVVVGGSIRAKYSTEREANELKRKLFEAFEQ